jgi:ABC-2 type transport system ATP-binding protein
MEKKNKPQAEPNDRPVVINVHDLQMRYGETTVLDGVDFSIRRGEVIVLLGPNGAGKTTTIEILEGFRIPSGGDIEVLGVNPAHGNEEWRARLGIVLQSWRDHSKWGVREFLDYFGKYYRPYSTAERPRPLNTDELLTLVGLEEHAHKQLASLSGGQRRRMDVAIGLVGNPEVLFLDEPTAGFDPKARRDFHDVIHRLSDLDDTTVLLTTHDLDEAEKLSDRILILADGKIVANGSADKLAREASNDAEVRWIQDGKQYVHAAKDATAYVRTLLDQHKTGISDLEVRRASLEDAYMKIVQKYEKSQQNVKGGK